MKYAPPNRRGARAGSRDHARLSRLDRPRERPVPVKKNPAPGFNGAGFRGVRETYVANVYEFLCARAAFGTPWVRVTGGDSVHAVTEKPLTIPENYVQFFKENAKEFELSPDGRYVAAKMPGEERARIPPPPSDDGKGPPSTDGKGSSSGPGTSAISTPCVSLSSSAASDDGFALAGERRRRRRAAPASPPANAQNQVGASDSTSGGYRAGDACRFAHAAV